MKQQPPSRDLDGLAWMRSSAGARKEKVRKRELTKPRHHNSARPYAELHAASAFSFLDGASLPEDLVASACETELPAMALVDRNGVYGAPRFYTAAKKAGVRALVGAEIVFEEDISRFRDFAISQIENEPSHEKQKSRNRTAAQPRIEIESSHESESQKSRNREIAKSRNLRLVPDSPLPQSRLTLLVESQQGYRNLCRLLTAGALGREKGDARYDWNLIEQYGEGLHLLTGGDEGLVAQTLARDGVDAARKVVERLHSLFPGRVHVELQRHHRKDEEHRNQALADLAHELHLPLIATNGVRYAHRRDKALHDVLTCIRNGTNLDKAGRLLGINSERFVRSASEMSKLFADLPDALDHAWELSQQLDFTLANLGYRFPDYPLPEGETPNSFLRQIAWNGARVRFRPLTAKAQAQIEKELAMIEKLDLAGYFLIVWDIVQFCAKNNIMVQGRGSAANSAVCYALSITAVDPVKMELLFERFLSEERGEWPDIDLDLPSGDQREKVIQYVYQRYGAHGAAMTANVITYRERSAAREVGKSLGFAEEQIDRFAKQISQWTFGEIREKVDEIPAEMQNAGLDTEEVRVQHLVRLWLRIQNLPRHLGQHSGGMVMAGNRLDEVVPLEPASMPGRVVIQWDKDDCADLGIIKVDLLGLGMLAALEEAIPLIKAKEGVTVDLAHIPPDDPLVYKHLNEADTVGVFQVESRAQMATLPKNAPRVFYDIVVQVAIIRPGPIVGGMVRPFFERRQGKRPVEYPHPSLEPILKRTLGVPLFQEQLLRIAMVAAGFTGGEAEELRRAMGFKRSVERMAEIEKKLRDGMAKNGIHGTTQDEIVKSITSFALYGFPESHAASFALIAYASGYIRAHHPAAFYTALLNAWPMGFYHPATLVKDAQRHGVDVRPIDVAKSGWMCRWEDGAVRMGLRYVRGLQQAGGLRIEEEQAVAPFESVDELARRCRLRPDQLTKLAYSGALASFGLSRRAALWQASEAARSTGPLFEKTKKGKNGSPLREMSRLDETLADYDSMELTTGPHLIEHLRPELERQRIVSAADLKTLRNGSRVKTAGAVIVRQRPGTAKGFVFLTLEDETGMSQAIVRPDLFREYRTMIVSSPGLIVEGVLQNDEGQPSIRADSFEPLIDFATVRSHDFH